jgi:peptide/nickel transport system substrate-binding protein
MKYALIFLLLGLTACTSNRSSSDEKAITVALSAPPSTLDPRYATDATGTRIAGLLYSSLVRVGPDLKPVGDAAESFSQEGTTYRFKLRPGITFSNGRALDDSDIQASFDFARDPKSRYASSFSIIESVKSSLSTPEREVVIVLKKPSATFVSDLSTLKLLPSKELATLKSGEAPIGSGPFTLEKKDSNEIVLKARADHPYAKPKAPSVVFKIVRDDNTRVMKMIKGELDLAQAEFPPAKVLQLEKAENLVVHKYPGLAMSYMLLNLKDPTLSKPKVRQAMALAINRDAIVKHKLEGLATLATSLLTPVNPYFDSSLKQIEYAPEKAKALLAEVGSLPELVFKTSSVPAAVENGRLIAKNLEEVGFKIKLQSFEWGSFYGDVQAGRFQLATMRWVGTVDPDLYRQALHSKEVPPNGRNRGSYSSPQVDQWTVEAQATDKFEKRKQIYSLVQKKVLDDLPIVPLWYDTEVAIVSKKLSGYEPPRDGSFWILTQVEKK